MSSADGTDAILDGVPPRPPERFGRGFDIAVLALTAYALFLVLTFGYGRDQGIYAVVARSVLDGGMPYRDAWDFKPPGIYLVYALVRAVLGSSQLSIRVVEVLCLALMVRGMVLLARRWWGQPRIGLLAGALACLVHAQLDFWHTAQPESFGGMLIVWGLCVGTGTATGARRTRQLVFAGVLFGCAGLLKPPLAGAGAVLALFAAAQPWLEARRQRKAGAAPDRDGSRGAPDPALPSSGRGILRRSVVPVWAVLLGGVAPFVACGVWFAVRGAHGHLHQTLFVFTPHYTALGWEGRDILGLLYQAAAQWLVTYSSVFAGGVILCLAAVPRWWRVRNVTLLFAIIAILLFGVAIQGKFFPYHYAAVWPVTALVAALGWWQLWQRFTRWGAVGAVGFAVLFVAIGVMRSATKDVAESFWTRSAERTTLFFSSERDQERVDGLASVADVNAAGNRAVAQLLRRVVAPDQPVFIWGFEPVIYDLCNRGHASRYLYNVPQRVQWAAEATRAELMGELRVRPPSAIVVAHHDLIPMVTGDHLDSAHALEEFPALNDLVLAHYSWFERVQDFDVYLRRPPQSAPGDEATSAQSGRSDAALQTPTRHGSRLSLAAHSHD